MAEFLYDDVADYQDRTIPREPCPHCGAMIHGARHGKVTTCEECGEMLWHECTPDNDGLCHWCGDVLNEDWFFHTHGYMPNE